MGLIPLQYLPGETADTHGLTGKEKYSIKVPENLMPGQTINVEVSNGKAFKVRVRFDTDVELNYFKHGGILQFMVHKLLK